MREQPNQARVETAIATVAAMTEEEFALAAVAVGLRPREGVWQLWHEARR